MSNPFIALNQKRGVLLAAHRGYYGGNIPFNSHASFQIALNHDADIVELDVERSEDNKLFVFSIPVPKSTLSASTTPSADTPPISLPASASPTRTAEKPPSPFSVWRRRWTF